MRLYYWMFEEHKKEFIKIPKTEENHLGIELSEKASPIAVRDLYRFLVQSNDNEIRFDGKEISKRMIECFKKSPCYNLKTEKDKEKIIDYLNKHPMPDDPYIDI